MPKDTQADKLIELIAIAGELPINAIQRFEGGGKYKTKLITDLKVAGMIRTYYKDKLRGYRLTAKAKKSCLRLLRSGLSSTSQEIAIQTGSRATSRADADYTGLRTR